MAGIRIRIGEDFAIARFDNAVTGLLEIDEADASTDDWLVDPDVIIATVRISGEIIATRQSRFILGPQFVEASASRLFDY